MENNNNCLPTIIVKYCCEFVDKNTPINFLMRGAN